MADDAKHGNARSRSPGTVRVLPVGEFQGGKRTTAFPAAEVSVSSGGFVTMARAQFQPCVERTRSVRWHRSAAARRWAANRPRCQRARRRRQRPSKGRLNGGRPPHRRPRSTPASHGPSPTIGRVRRGMRRSRRRRQRDPAARLHFARRPAGRARQVPRPRPGRG